MPKRFPKGATHEEFVRPAVNQPEPLCLIRKIIVAAGNIRMVAVIGGGYTGLVAAYYHFQLVDNFAKPSKTLLVLNPRKICRPL
jgi:hypothetical protein